MDIPLAEAQIIWDHPPRGEKSEMDPPVKVIGPGMKDNPDYQCSWGACNAEFQQANQSTKLLMLFIQFQQIVMLYGIDAQAVHEAFLVIPEYREALLEQTPDLVPAEYRGED